MTPLINAPEATRLDVTTYPKGYLSPLNGSASTMAGQPIGRRVVLGAPQLDPARTRRLAELGLRAGTEVLVLHRTAGRGRVLAVGETRIALDRATLEAMPVAVTPEDAAEDATTDATGESDR